MSIIPSKDKVDLDMYYIDLVENKEIKSKPNSIKDGQNNSQQGENEKIVNNNELNNNNYDYIYNSINKNNLYGDENSKIDNISISNTTNISQTKRKFIRKSSFMKNKSNYIKEPLYPDPILSLNYIIGYTSKNCPTIEYNSFGDYDSMSDVNRETKVNQTKKYFYYCSGSNIIKYDPYNKAQKFFMGHSKSISHFIIGCKGEILYSGEEGVNSIIRIWKVENFFCIKMLTTPLDKLKSLSESLNSKYLCVAGSEQLKELIVIFKIENLQDVNIFIKKNMQYQINSIKFVPYSDDILISCGNENIKFYRIKNNSLFHKSVVLSQYVKNNFLCIDFNRSIFGDNYTDKGKAYIGSSSGSVFQISCLSQELESVYLVQNSPILSISSNEVFIVTGSEDGYCRVWPVGFEEFIMEAKHDSGVCSVDISYDSMEILCGTLNGSIGLLNVHFKNYITLLRSPNCNIKLLFVHPLKNYIFTVENFGMFDCLKIWDLQIKDEIFEYNSENDLISCINSNLLKSFVCGFTSGIIKVFDFDKNQLVYQCKPFKSTVSKVIFIQNYEKIIAMSAFGNLSIHDCNSNYSQIKIINIDKQCLFTDISLSIDENYFSTIGPESKFVLTWNSFSFDKKNNINLNVNSNKNIYLAKLLCLISNNLLGVGLTDCSIRFYTLGKYEGIFIKEIRDVHLKGINKFICSKNYSYFLTCGEEGLIKIWDMKSAYNNYISYQQYIGHSNGVSGLSLIDYKGIVISSSNNNGIYFWNFLGEITSSKGDILKVLDQLDDPLYVKNLKLKLNNNSLYSTKSVNKFNNKYLDDNKEKLLTKDVRMLHNERKYYAENKEISEKLLGKNLIDKDDNELNNGFKVIPKFPNENDEEKITINYSNKDYIISPKTLNKYESSYFENSNVKHKLLFASKYLPTLYQNNNINKNESENKGNEEKESENNSYYKLEIKYCIGLSTNSMNNIVFNKEKNWYAYIVNNKVIIEFLNNERKQKILKYSKDELSCLILSNDLNYLISAIGQVNKEDYASIFIYDSNTFELVRRLNLHPKGVQYITISKDNKYMLTIGTKSENSICLWDLINFKVIDMKTINSSPFIGVIENSFNTNNKMKFITCTFDIISFWELNNENKLENIELKLEEIATDLYENEFITGINLYKNEYDLDDKYIIISTNKGNIILIDNENKKFLKKYLISKFPLTKIYFSDSYFICGGEGPILYIWYKHYENNDFSNFLENQKPNLLFLDGQINSISIYSLRNECMVSTGKGSIFYVKLEEKSIIKLLSSHKNTEISSIYTDISDLTLITLGKEEHISCWTIDSIDQKFTLKKRNQKPNSIIFNYQDNILLTQYENSYLSAFSIKNFISLGTIYIPNEDISKFSFIFDNSHILLITFQLNIYVISIKNYKPLSMLYTKINIPKNNEFYPNNQLCTCITCSNINNMNANKSYSSFTFSEGTTSIFLMEKTNGNVIFHLLDTFNLILLHSRMKKDENSNELYNNLINFRSEYKSASVFSKKYNEVIICYHELLQFILIRDFIRKETINILGINYFPFCMNINSNGKFISIGTKEGIIIFISEGEENYYNNNCKPVLYKGHYDTIHSVKFSHDSTKLFTSGRNEMLVWDINIKI